MGYGTILIADDEDLVRWSLKERLTRDGHTLLEATTAGGALAQMSDAVDLVILDVRLPDGDGLDVLRQIKEAWPDTPVILMTAHSSIQNAVEAMRLGAYDYINKPFNLEEVALEVGKALETSRLRREVKTLRTSQGHEHRLEAIIGISPAMVALRTLVNRVAASPASTVLLTGETGTGKDLVARTIHYASSRARRPFVTITCSAIPEQLLESELFGHEQGAFTDARQMKRGLVETADGGTIFLDEIGEMTAGLQAKLLKFLEDRTFKRVGGLKDIRVDVRVIAATNRELGAEVHSGRFREDLYYRLQVMPVSLPALRDRTGDTRVLAEHFVARYNREFRKGVQRLTPEALEAIERYRWPGNVRELRNTIERAMLLASGDRLGREDFSMLARPAAAASFVLPSGGVRLEDVERQLLVQALERSGGNQTHAGELLGINRDQVRYRIEKFGLERPILHRSRAVAAQPSSFA